MRSAPAGFEHARPFHLLERGHDVEAAVRPVRRRLAQQPVRQVRQLARDARIDVEDGRRLVGADPGQRLRRGLGPERRDAGHHLVEHRAEREQIGPVIDGQPARLLRRHRVAGAEDRAGTGQVLLAAAAIGLGEAEVEDLGPAGGGDHHVRRLQVAVHDVVRVRLGQAVGNLARELDGAQRARQAVAQHAIERLALDQLHDDPVAFVGLDDVVDVDDGRVVEARRHPRLAAEAQLAGGVGGVWQQPLDGQRPLQGLIEGAVDRAHAARAEALFDQVVADAIGNARSIVRPRLHGPQCTPGTVAVQRPSAARSAAE